LRRFAVSKRSVPIGFGAVLGTGFVVQIEILSRRNAGTREIDT